MQHGHECKLHQSLCKNNHFKQVSRDNRIGVNPVKENYFFRDVNILGCVSNN